MTTRVIEARYPGKCSVCGGSVAPGQRVSWDKEARTVSHETCVAAAVPTVGRAATFAPTAEQMLALEAFGTGRSLAIEAGAGTGKTSTLVLLAESAPARRGLYLAFNRAIVKDAGAKMPGSVTCSTAHSLAFRAVGGQYKHRLDNSRRMRSLHGLQVDIALRLGVTEVKLDDGKSVSKSFLGGLAMASVIRFCQSADLEPSVYHVPYIEGIDSTVNGVRSYENNRVVAREIVPAVKRAWADLMNVNGNLPFRHDHYLKAYQLSGPSITADYIMFDEAQDASPVLLAIVEAQTHAQLVYVGDSQQAIYGFTGAVDALDKIKETGASTAFLTQSFRFGPAVAAVANGILDGIQGAVLRLVGTEAINSTVGTIDAPEAILCRTNAQAVRTVIRLQTEDKVAALVGGGEEVVRFAKAADELMTVGSTDHPDLACFESWGEVKQYVDEDEQGGELRLNVKLVEDFGVDTILAALDRTVREDDADVIVSTAHKAKGREWVSVQLAGDFPEPDKMGVEEMRLLYVAVTRARRELDVDAVMLLNGGGQSPSPFTVVGSLIAEVDSAGEVTLR